MSSCVPPASDPCCAWQRHHHRSARRRVLLWRDILVEQLHALAATGRCSSRVWYKHSRLQRAWRWALAALPFAPQLLARAALALCGGRGSIGGGPGQWLAAAPVRFLDRLHRLQVYREVDAHQLLTGGPFAAEPGLLAREVARDPRVRDAVRAVVLAGLRVLEAADAPDAAVPANGEWDAPDGGGAPPEATPAPPVMRGRATLAIGMLAGAVRALLPPDGAGPFSAAAACERPAAAAEAAARAREAAAFLRARILGGAERGQVHEEQQLAATLAAPLP
jgi:hypothetical protein